MANHGQSQPPTPTYRVWKNMKNRCLNPNSTDFNLYGGRGITICDRWLHSFTNFMADMGQKPTERSLDRFPDVNGNYEPSNCRWATASEQAHNRRNYELITYMGLAKSRYWWAQVLGVSYRCLVRRLNKYPLELALTFTNYRHGQWGASSTCKRGHLLSAENMWSSGSKKKRCKPCAILRQLKMAERRQS